MDEIDLEIIHPSSSDLDDFGFWIWDGSSRDGSKQGSRDGRDERDVEMLLRVENN